MLPLFFAVRKFFECEVQIPVGFLTRPVTAYHTHHDAGTHEHRDHNDGSLHTNIYANGAPFEEVIKSLGITRCPTASPTSDIYGVCSCDPLVITGSWCTF